MSLLLLFKGGPVARTLTADAGSYSLFGQPANLLQGRRLAADVGAYALAGQAAALLYGRDLIASAGAFSITGQNAALAQGGGFRSLMLEIGGAAVSPAGFRSLALELGAGATPAAAVVGQTGSYTLSGQAATLKRGLLLSAGAGSYTLYGVAAQRDVVVTAEAGAYSVTGYDATLTQTAGVGGGFFSLLLEIGGGANVSVGGGYDDDKSKPRKRRFIVERDGKLLVYASQSAALRALDQAPIAAEVTPEAPEAPAPVPEAEEVVDLPTVQAYAELAGRIEDYNAAWNSRHYEALLALFEHLRDEEDIEMLLLAT